MQLRFRSCHLIGGWVVGVCHINRDAVPNPVPGLRGDPDAWDLTRRLNHAALPDDGTGAGSSPRCFGEDAYGEEGADPGAGDRDRDRDRARARARPDGDMVGDVPMYVGGNDGGGDARKSGMNRSPGLEPGIECSNTVGGGVGAGA